MEVLHYIGRIWPWQLNLHPFLKGKITVPFLSPPAMRNHIATNEYPIFISSISRLGTSKSTMKKSTFRDHVLSPSYVSISSLYLDYTVSFYPTRVDRYSLALKYPHYIPAISPWHSWFLPPFSITSPLWPNGRPIYLVKYHSAMFSPWLLVILLVVHGCTIIPHKTHLIHILEYNLKDS